MSDKTLTTGSHFTKLNDEQSCDVVDEVILKYDQGERPTKQMFKQRCIAMALRQQMLAEIAAAIASVKQNYSGIIGEAERAEKLGADLQTRVLAGNYDAASIRDGSLPGAFTDAINQLLRQETVVNSSTLYYSNRST